MTKLVFERNLDQDQKKKKSVHFQAKLLFKGDMWVLGHTYKRCK